MERTGTQRVLTTWDRLGRARGHMPSISSLIFLVTVLDVGCALGSNRIAIATLTVIKPRGFSPKDEASTVSSRSFRFPDRVRVIPRTERARRSALGSLESVQRSPSADSFSAGGERTIPCHRVPLARDCCRAWRSRAAVLPANHRAWPLTMSLGVTQLN